MLYSAIKLREEECDKSKDVERREGEREGAETEQHYLSQKKKKNICTCSKSNEPANMTE